MAKLWTYSLAAGNSITFGTANGFKWITVYNLSTSTANGTLTGTMEAYDSSGTKYSSTAVQIEPGQPSTIISEASEYSSITITAPAGCTLNIIAGVI